MIETTFPMQGKRNPRVADPPIDNAKNPQFLVLISENFMEARAILSRPGSTNLPSNPSPVKMDIAPVASVTGPPPTSMPSGCFCSQYAAPFLNVLDIEYHVFFYSAKYLVYFLFLMKELNDFFPNIHLILFLLLSFS